MLFRYIAIGQKLVKLSRRCYSVIDTIIYAKIQTYANKEARAISYPSFTVTPTTNNINYNLTQMMKNDYRVCDTSFSTSGLSVINNVAQLICTSALEC